MSRAEPTLPARGFEPPERRRGNRRACRRPPARAAVRRSAYAHLTHATEQRHPHVGYAGSTSATVKCYVELIGAVLIDVGKSANSRVPHWRGAVRAA
jgi:hypothetical protein